MGNLLVTRVSQWQDLPEKMAGYFVVRMPSINQTMFIGKARDIRRRLRLYDMILYGKVFDKFGVEVLIYTNPAPWMTKYLESNLGPHYTQQERDINPSTKN